MGSRFFTRSRNAPEWTMEEMMALVSHVAAVEEEYGGDFSSHQKWEVVSSNLANVSSNNNHRSASQCRRKRDDLITQYTSIRDTCKRTYDYWSLDPNTKERLGLPFSFDRDLYALIDDVLKCSKSKKEKKISSPPPSSSPPHSHHPIYDLGISSEEDEQDPGRPDDDEDFVVTAMHPSPQKVRQIKCEDTSKKVAEMTSCLQEGVGQIEAVLRGDLSDDAKDCGNQFGSPELDAETNFKRQQADQLIRMFGSLVGNIQQLNELLERGVPS